MALLATRKITESLLSLPAAEGALFNENHIFEPEFHQEKYVSACVTVSKMKGAFQIGKAPGLIFGPARGVQPSYADDESDQTSLRWEGMTNSDGSVLKKSTSKLGSTDICALKSASVRRGYLDYSLARSVSPEFHVKRKAAAIQKNDILVNSTGDGTIGRVAVFNESFPAMVDGHISIIRLEDSELAWYIGAFLLSELGQLQMYRYINGSSGQVEIYPQDISRVWVKPPKSEAHKKEVAVAFKHAAQLHADFYKKLQVSLAMI